MARITKSLEPPEHGFRHRDHRSKKNRNRRNKYKRKMLKKKRDLQNKEAERLDKYGNVILKKRTKRYANRSSNE